MKTTTMIKATTRAATGMGEIENGFIVRHLESKF